jgi:hypothetical protein
MAILPGQIYHGELRDRRGNGLPSVVVEVLDSGTATVLATTATDFDGAFAVPLTGDLATSRLVDLRFSGGSFPTKVVVGLVLG